MYSKCQQCTRVVLAKQDGSCPSCGGTHTLLPYNSDAGKRLTVSLASESKLPPVCIACGRDTTQVLRHCWRRRSPHAPSAASPGLVGVLIQLFFSRILGQYDQTIELHIPKCTDCGKDEVIPVRFRWDEYVVELPCAADFKSRFEGSPTAPKVDTN